MNNMINLQEKTDKIIENTNEWLSSYDDYLKIESNFPSYIIHLLHTIKGTRPFINYGDLKFLKPRNLRYSINYSHKIITDLYFHAPEMGYKYYDRIEELNRKLKISIKSYKGTEIKSLVEKEDITIGKLELNINTITEFEF